MELAASGPVERRRRGRLQQLQQRLGILDRTMPSSTMLPLVSRRTLTAESPSNPAPAARAVAQQRRAGIAPGAGKQPLHRLEYDYRDGPRWRRPRAPSSFRRLSATTRSLASGPDERPGRQLHQFRQRADRHHPVAPDEAIIVLDPADPIGRQTHRLRSRHPWECRTDWPPVSTTMMRDSAMFRGRSSRTVVPAPTAARERHPAADLLDGGAHHIHADAAPGNIRDFGGGRKAGGRRSSR